MARLLRNFSEEPTMNGALLKKGDQRLVKKKEKFDSAGTNTAGLQPV